MHFYVKLDASVVAQNKAGKTPDTDIASDVLALFCVYKNAGSNVVLLRDHRCPRLCLNAWDLSLYYINYGDESSYTHN